MPVTAKLSRKFYQVFGDDIANELVEWFNQVDATYRADLRELNELNFARFDAKLEQRFAEHDAKLEQRFAEYDAKIERRFSAVEARFASLEAEFRQALAEQRSELIKWMFVFWAGNVVTTAGLVFGMVALIRR